MNSSKLADLTSVSATVSLYNTTIHSSTYEEIINENLLSVIPYILIILSAATIFFNGLVLAAFVKNDRLRTAFNFYLISLAIADTGQAGLDMPFTILAQFYPVWPLSRAACSFNLYAKWMFAGVVRNAHTLISLNRVWALFWPIGYKNYHTKVTAGCFSAGSWVYVNVVLLPGLIPDALYYRPDDGSCAVNLGAQPGWGYAAQFVFNSTLFVIIVSFVFVSFHSRAIVVSFVCVDASKLQSFGRSNQTLEPFSERPL